MKRLFALCTLIFSLNSFAQVDLLTFDQIQDALEQFEEGSYQVSNGWAINANLKRIFSIDYFKDKEIRLEKKEEKILITFPRTMSMGRSWTQELTTTSYDQSFHSWVHGGGPIPIFIPYRTKVFLELRATVTEKKIHNAVTFVHGYKYKGQSFVRTLEKLDDGQLHLYTATFSQGGISRNEFVLKKK